MMNKRTHITASIATRLEKRMGKSVWDGVFYNRDSITDPLLLILDNKAGREIREILKLEELENCCHRAVRVRPSEEL